MTEMLTATEVMRLTVWAAQECEWQESGEKSVSRLVNAYFFLANNPLTLTTVEWLGYMVEPEKNAGDGWRTVDVRVGMSVKPPHREVNRLMGRWFENLEHLNPTERFREFEEIHPFRDGNGRVGALLFNLWNGTYEPSDLQYPPNLWDDPRRYDA